MTGKTAHPPPGNRRTRRGLLAVALASAVLLPVFLPSPLAGQGARTRVVEGNRLYEEGRFDEAHQKYLEALLEDPESPLIRFNDGAALFRNQDYQRAMERFQEALESDDPSIQNSAWYNLGNALYRQQQLPESLEAFKRALRADPSDADAKHNLERVLEQLQQQEQEQQQQGDDQNQENQDQNDQEQEGQNPQQQESPQPQETPSPESEEEESQGESQSQPGEMTPEEAQRLLDAIQEDQGDVNRRRLPATGRRPRKKW